MQPDNELLRRYATTGSEAAFTELVQRHVNLVYSAALRQAGGDTHLAHDVAQSVFSDLARKAASLLNRESLSGWLYTSAYFAANKMVRSEIRRRQHEERFMREPAHDNSQQMDWEKLRPLLDVAMHSLKESDRDAILLRYFENRPYAEVGAKFGLNENAARLRVERALEKLRALLAKRGLAAGTTLASILSANAVQTVPNISAANLAIASLAGATTTGSFRIFSATRIKLGLGTLLAVGGLTLLLAQRHAQKLLESQNETATQQLALLRNENADLSNQLQEAASARAIMEAQQNELLRLQAALARLTNSINTPQITTSAAPTNEMRERPDVVVHVMAKMTVVPAAQMQNLSFGWAPAGDGASVLSAEQFASISNALTDKGDLRLLIDDQVITGNGHAAESASRKPVSIDGTNATIGVLFGVTPSFNSSAFALNLLTQLSLLDGDAPQSGTQSLQASNQVTLFPGQTTVIEKDILPGSWLADALSLPNGQNKLLVFVTPDMLPGKVIWKIPFHHANFRTNSPTLPPATLSEFE